MKTEVSSAPFVFRLKACSVLLLQVYWNGVLTTNSKLSKQEKSQGRKENGAFLYLRGPGANTTPLSVISPESDTSTSDEYK